MGSSSLSHHDTRTARRQGRKRAKARGVKFGRPSKFTPHQRTEIFARLAKGDSLADIARSYNVDPTTIGRLRLANGNGGNGVVHP